MLTDRLNELLEYLSTLSQVQGAGHYVNDEIKEVIREIRIELGLEKQTRETLKDSRKLVFEAKLGGSVSFRQQTLFEAVFGSVEKEISVMMFQNELDGMKQAIEVLRGMEKRVTLTLLEKQLVVKVNH